jgi:hypothetical protein
VHDRVRVPLRADREVEPLTARDVEVPGDRRRVEVEVGVDERDPLPVRGERAGLDGVALAEVPVVVEDADALAPALEEPLGRPVDRTVGDDDHLDLPAGDPVGDRAPDRLDVADDLLAAVVDGYHYRQEGAHRSHPTFARRRRSCRPVISDGRASKAGTS